jgi:predicted dehydrogenase
VWSKQKSFSRRAGKRRRVLLVDHTFVYSAPVRAIKQMLACGVLGALWYYDSVRANLGIVRGDVNVLWDLATHDLAVLDYLHPAQPAAVQAAGVSPASPTPGRDEATDCVPHAALPGQVHRAYARKPGWRRSRSTRPPRRQPAQMVVWDDLEPVEKVKLYDSGVEPGAMPGGLHYRSGGVTPAALDVVEPLRALVDHFVDCVLNG